MNLNALIIRLDNFKLCISLVSGPTTQQDSCVLKKSRVVQRSPQLSMLRAFFVDSYLVSVREGSSPRWLSKLVLGGGLVGCFGGWGGAGGFLVCSAIFLL